MKTKEVKQEIDAEEAISLAAASIFDEAPGLSVGIGLKHTEKEALKQSSRFQALKDQIFHERGRKDVFKIVQAPDRRKQSIKRVTSLRYMRTVGVTHYDSSGLRHFIVGSVLYNTILMYIVNDIKYTKIIIHKVQDVYRDGSVSSSYLCDEMRPYTLKNEVGDFDEDRILVLKNAVYCIESLVNDYINKDFINYSKSSMRTLMIVGFVCVFFGFAVGALLGVMV